jgi:FtsH-binding integral membrane protein
MTLRTIFILARCFAAFIAVWAVENHPYDYYIFTRWVVFGTCCYGLYFNRQIVWKSTSPFFALLGLIFNPIVPFHIHKETWHLFDISAAVIFLISIAFDDKNNQQKE